MKKREWEKPENQHIARLHYDTQDREREEARKANQRKNAWRAAFLAYYGKQTEE